MAAILIANGLVTVPNAQAALTCAQGGTCVVGDTGPGGGTVYYVDLTGFPCGPSFSNTGSPTGGLCYYLEVAPSTWYQPSGDPTGLKMTATRDDAAPIPGITPDSTPNLTRGGIGLGYKNTVAFETFVNNNTVGAGLVRSRTIGGKSDWYIGTSAESNLLCQWAKNKTQDVTSVCGAGGIVRGNLDTSYYYWTSSVNVTVSGTPPTNYYGDYLVAFGAGSLNTINQFTDAGVFIRPIRAFGLLSSPSFTLSSTSENKTVKTALTGYSISSSGGAISSFSISPAAPAGLTFDTSSGLLTGSPLSVAGATTYTITGTNASGSSTATFTLTVIAAVDDAGASRQAQEQRELLELLSVIPSIASLSTLFGTLAVAVSKQKCVKGKAIKYVKRGAKCPKGFVKK